MGTITTTQTICDHCKVDRSEVDFNYGDINAKLKISTSVPYGYMGEGFVDKIWLCPTCTEQFLAWLYNR